MPESITFYPGRQPSVRVIEPHPCARINSLMGLNQSLLYCHSGTLALGESIIRSPVRATQTVNAQVCDVYIIQHRIREGPFVSKASIRKVWVGMWVGMWVGE